ncbi:MAG: protein kinase domain-containing protein [Acidobacteriota bacterium]
MTLSAGSRLGPYEIVSPLGAGGMGEVYRARDSRLQRTVAIKVLPAHLSADSNRRQRLEREARAISSLNHPHICTLYDIGHESGLDFLVMEYVEGETLDRRLAKGLLSPEQALRYATEVAEALDNAHRQGVVHRDLKPSNIMLTKSGTKLLDFGLAKLRPAEKGAAFANLSAIPTEGGKDLTAEGTILGTFQYMAPEQLEGQEADPRTDVFAFGLLVYEMITGRKAFEAKSQASLIGAILHSQPAPMSSLRPMAPLALDRLVHKCLAKDPDERWQSASDLASELRWIAQGGSDPALALHPVKAFRPRLKLAWYIAAALFLLNLLLGYFVFRFATFEPDSAMQVLSVVPPRNSSFDLTNGPVLISPDGHAIVFYARTEGLNQLWIRRLDSQEPELLGGAEGYDPFWSADSRFVGFFNNDKLKRIEVSGGPAQTIARVSDGRGGTWNRDGVILFTPGPRDGIYRVSASGGEAVSVTKLDASREETGHWRPHFLPDGQHFLYLVRSSKPENNGIYFGSLSGDKASRLVVREDSAPVYAPQGYLLFIREKSLMAQPFDLKRLQVHGEAAVIARDVQYVPTYACAAFSASETGMLLYGAGSEAVHDQLFLCDRTGKRLKSIGEVGEYDSLRISPDSSRIALERIDPKSRSGDIWVADLNRGVATRLTLDPMWEYQPVWSPDSAAIIYQSNREGPGDLYKKDLTGAGKEELILKSPSHKTPCDWSRDYLLYAEVGQNTKWDLWVLPLAAERKPVVYWQTDFDEMNARFSPDGKWVAFQSDESGKNEVYAAPFPGPGGKTQISVSGGSKPKWGSGGKEIVYLAPDNQLVSVGVSGQGAALKVGSPLPLFETRGAFEVLPSGQQIIVNTLPGGNAPTPLTLVLNWTAKLKK